MKYFILFFVVILIASCSESEDNAIETHILSGVSNSKNDIIRLDTLVQFDWDRLYILPPYTNTTIMDSRLLSVSDIIKKTYVEMKDDRNVLVFFKGNTFITAITIYLKDMNFSPAVKSDYSGKLTFLSPAEFLRYDPEKREVYNFSGK